MATTFSTTTEQIKKVSTTVPHFEKLEPIHTNHLIYIIRPLFYPSDIEAYHSLWKQPIIHLDQNKYNIDPRTDFSKTRDRLLRITKALPSHGIHYGIFNKEDGKEGELIGEGGVKISESSWPSLYYTFRKDKENSLPHFLFMLLNYWWSIPRKEKEIEVYSFSIPEDSLGILRPFELLCTETRPDDKENEGYLKKANFDPCGTLPNGNTYWRHTLDVTVSTTLPILENLSAPFYSSERLIIRTPNIPSDVEAFYSLRKQTEPMKLLGQIQPDKDSNQTRKALEHTQPGYTSVRFGIFLKEKDGREGELIGEGGVCAFKGGWPYLYYIFKEEYWNYGYGTEFVKALIKFWRSLPRKEAQIRVLYSSVDLRETPKVTEILEATTKPENVGSQKVLQKVGFEKYGEHTNTGYICWRYPPFQKKD